MLGMIYSLQWWKKIIKIYFKTLLTSKYYGAAFFETPSSYNYYNEDNY